MFFNTAKILSQVDSICLTTAPQLIGHSSPQTQQLTIIPIVFHVIRLNDGSEDVSDYQIDLQIDVLNSAFQNSNISFYKYSIVRTNNTTWSNRALDKYDSTHRVAMKNALGVDPTHKLNVYICKSGNDISVATGISTFPWSFSENSNSLGVIIEKGVLPDGESQNYNLGFICVHEVGHYLGLFHTFEPNGYPSGCNPYGDYVDDTPPQQKSNVNCTNNAPGCNGAPSVLPGNYMDYQPDVCAAELVNTGETNIIMS